jgi:uncharacterized cupredoxin-like copper-binding protein
VGAAAATAAVLAATGLGQAAGGTTLHLKAAPSGALKYDKTKLSASAGKVTVVMKNPAGTHTKHGIEVEGKGVEKRGKNVKPGKTSRVTLTLKPGKYEFYCPVDGHKAAGMKGKLTVK